MKNKDPHGRDKLGKRNKKTVLDKYFKRVNNAVLAQLRASNPINEFIGEL